MPAPPQAISHFSWAADALSQAAKWIDIAHICTIRVHLYQRDIGFMLE
jgi:hypothetical protein